jgi:hypothetical protein
MATCNVIMLPCFLLFLFEVLYNATSKPDLKCRVVKIILEGFGKQEVKEKVKVSLYTPRRQL